MPKAYAVIENSSGIYGIVFAESASKAKYVAFNCYIEDLCYNDVYYSFKEFVCSCSVKRCKDADEQYRGHSLMDWFDPLDRLYLVREQGWCCNEETDIDCENCIALEFCSRKEEWEEIKDEREKIDTLCE
jgi:hypothetical protein